LNRRILNLKVRGCHGSSRDSQANYPLLQFETSAKEHRQAVQNVATIAFCPIARPASINGSVRRKETL